MKETSHVRQLEQVVKLATPLWVAVWHTQCACGMPCHPVHPVSLLGLRRCQSLAPDNVCCLDPNLCTKHSLQGSLRHTVLRVPFLFYFFYFYLLFRPGLGTHPAHEQGSGQHLRANTCTQYVSTHITAAWLWSSLRAWRNDITVQVCGPLTAAQLHMSALDWCAKPVSVMRMANYAHMQLIKHCAHPHRPTAALTESKHTTNEWLLPVYFAPAPAQAIREKPTAMGVMLPCPGLAIPQAYTTLIRVKVMTTCR